MKRILLLLVTCVLVSLSAHAQTIPGSVDSTSEVSKVPARLTVQPGFGKLRLAFEPNRGQTDSEVKFLARGRGYILFLTSTEAALVLRGDAPASLRMKLVGSNPNAQVSGLGEMPGRSNYFMGNDPAKWRTGIPHYSRVRVEAIYPGIDVVYYGTNERELEYDFIVAPGADPGQIRLAVEGASRLSLDSQGNLALDLTGSGSPGVSLLKPRVYQETDGARREIAASYVLHTGNQVGFELADYDTTRPLILDPVVLSYSTYLGGDGSDRGRSIAVDSLGDAYITGCTSSSDFPTTPGAFDTTFGGPVGTCNDVFVGKLTADGTSLDYSTYVGGGGNDNGEGIAIDSSGNVFVTGETSSSDFPTTPGVIQTNLVSGVEAFVVKLDTTGSALIYSSYLGGDRNDKGNAITADSSGNAYVTGETTSTNFPTTMGALDTTCGNDGTCISPDFDFEPDAFIAKIDSNGTMLLYSTYLGDAFLESGGGIAVDTLGNSYIAGSTSSPSFPTMNGFDSSLGGGVCGGNFVDKPCLDGFLTKINADGSALLYSTFLGGFGVDAVAAVSIDSSGNAYVTGVATVGTTPGVFDATCTAFDALVVKINTTMSGAASLVYSTCLGNGSSNANSSFGNAIAVDGSGNAYVTGVTRSSSFPTQNPFQLSFGGGGGDAFVAKLNPTAATLVYSSFLGGSDGTESGLGIALDTAGNAYVTGRTTASNFPVTPGTLQSVAASGEDGFVAKITELTTNPVPSLNSTTPTSATVGGAGFTLTVRGTNFLSNSVVRWEGSDRTTTFVHSSQLQAAISAADIATAGLAQITVFTPAPDGGTSNAIAFSVNNPAPVLTDISPTTIGAGGADFTLTATGGDFVPSSVVRWNGADRTTHFMSSAQLTADIPASDIASVGSAQVTVFNPSPAGGTSGAKTLSVNPTPAINPGGAVNAASFAPGAAGSAGGIAAVFGTALASSTAVAGSLPLPTTLGGATMQFTVNPSFPVPKFFAAASQVNIQIPWELAGQSSAALTDTVDSVTSAAEVVSLAAFAPGLFSTNQNGMGQGAILIANTPNLAAPMGMFPGSRPAVRGVDFLEIYWTGGGPVNPPVATGVAASANPLSQTTTMPTVTIGGVDAPVLFSGLAPGFVGLYVVTLQVPAGAPTGAAVPVVLTIGGVQSNAVSIAVE